jgi:25S rRNA (uracil2843-N3)-methyltransferase
VLEQPDIRHLFEMPRHNQQENFKALYDDNKAATASYKHKKKPKAANTPAPKVIEKKTERVSNSDIPFELQQRCLNVFRDALWTGSDDIATIQEVKGHLFNRDFAKAFGSEPYLRAYALRWSASRALGYLQVFEDVWDHVFNVIKRSPRETALQVLALGAGAGAELVGLAGFVGVEADNLKRAVSLELVDIANWGQVVEVLENATRASPADASAGDGEGSAAMAGHNGFNVLSSQSDLLDWDEQTLTAKAGPAHLTTIMFTLNELYSTSVPKTQRLLYGLTAAIAPGALLLVVDSPGSYSTVTINGAEKKYPMQWLLDHTMLSAKDKAPAWEKVASDESKWFRLPEALEYPIKLENMRYQYHLYKRLANETPMGPMG